MSAIFLCHCDGTNGSTTFTDSAGSCTATAAGTATVSTTQSKFGGASANFASTGHISVSSIPSLGTGDFTIEQWVYGTSAATQGIFDFRTSAGGILYLDGSNILNLFTPSGLVSSGGTVSLNAWHHVALVRNGGTTTCYLDGSSIFSGADGGSYSTTCVIGDSSGGGAVWTGYIDEIRFSDTAVYTANFTPPTSAFGGSTNVGAASGAGVASGIGASTATATASSTGAGTATGIGSRTAAAVGSSAGSSTVIAVGASTAAAIGNAVGSGAVSGVGSSASAGQGMGSATGAAIVSGVGTVKVAAVGTAAGAATSVSTGSSIASAVGLTAGAGTASGTGTGAGTTTQSAVGTAVGSGDAQANGTSRILTISPRVGMRRLQSLRPGIRRITEPQQMRREYRYPKKIIPGHQLNIYKETVPDVYADSDTYSTGP